MRKYVIIILITAIVILLANITIKKKTCPIREAESTVHIQSSGVWTNEKNRESVIQDVHGSITREAEDLILKGYRPVSSLVIKTNNFIEYGSVEASQILELDKGESYE